MARLNAGLFEGVVPEVRLDILVLGVLPLAEMHVSVWRKTCSSPVAGFSTMISCA